MACEQEQANLTAAQLAVIQAQVAVGTAGLNYSAALAIAQNDPTTANMLAAIESQVALSQAIAVLGQKLGDATLALIALNDCLQGQEGGQGPDRASPGEQANPANVCPAPALSVHKKPARS